MSLQSTEAIPWSRHSLRKAFPTFLELRLFGFDDDFIEIVGLNRVLKQALMSQLSASGVFPQRPRICPSDRRRTRTGTPTHQPPASQMFRLEVDTRILSGRTVALGLTIRQ